MMLGITSPGTLGWEVFKSTTLASDAASVSITGLDLASDKFYLIKGVWKNTSAADFYMEVNSDAVLTNYYYQCIVANNAVIAGARGNSARLGGVDANNAEMLFNGVMCRDVAGYPRFNAFTSHEAPNAIKMENFAWIHNDTTNVSSIQFVPSAGNVAAGSYFKIWRGRV